MVGSKVNVDWWHFAHDDWHNRHVVLIFSLFTNNVRTAGPIGMGEALIDVFPHREDDGAS